MQQVITEKVNKIDKLKILLHYDKHMCFILLRTVNKILELCQQYKLVGDSYFSYMTMSVWQPNVYRLPFSTHFPISRRLY